MQFTRKKKIASAVAVGAMALASGGVAIAYWTNSGATGSGTASTTTANTANLAFTNTTISGLAPGVAAVPFTVTVTNNGTQNTEVTSVKAYLTVAEVTTPPASGGSYICSGADYKLDGTAGAVDTSTAVTLAGWTAADLTTSGGGQSETTTTAANSLQFNDLSGTNQDNCQGATVTIHYFITSV